MRKRWLNSIDYRRNGAGRGECTPETEIGQFRGFLRGGGLSQDRPAPKLRRRRQNRLNRHPLLVRRLPGIGYNWHRRSKPKRDERNERQWLRVRRVRP